MLDVIISVLKSRSKKLVFLHHNADLDALGSALALYFSFPDITLGAPDNISKTARRLHDVFKVPIETGCRTDAFDHVIVVDTAMTAGIGIDASQLGRRLIVIDHHVKPDYICPGTSPESSEFSGIYYSDSDRKSCAEIIYKIIKQAGVALRREAAISLLSGIIADTAHFRHADTHTLKTVISIIEETGIDLDHSISSIANQPEDISERIAVLKGMQRMKIDRVGTWLIAGSVVGSHEAHVCNAMLTAGADVSIVASQRENDSRASSRARAHAVRFGLNLGIIMRELGKEVGGEGGGHAAAAGINYVGDAEALLDMCMERVKKWTVENNP